MPAQSLEYNTDDRQDAYFAAMNLGIQGSSTLDIALANLGVDLIPGSRVLDIGAGPSARLQWELTVTQPGTDVVSLEPFLSEDSDDARDYPASEWTNGDHDQTVIEVMRKHRPKLVAGLAQQLPFADETFDTVVSHAAVPQHLPQPHRRDHEANAQYARTFSEALRVTKRGGGNIAMAPMTETVAEEVMRTMSILGICGVQYDIECFDVPEYARWSVSRDEVWYRFRLHKY